MAFTTKDEFRKARDNGLLTCTAMEIKDKEITGKFDKWDKLTFIERANWIFYQKFDNNTQVLQHFDMLIRREAISKPNHPIVTIDKNSTDINKTVYTRLFCDYCKIWLKLMFEALALLQKEVLQIEKSQHSKENYADLIDFEIYCILDRESFMACAEESYSDINSITLLAENQSLLIRYNNDIVNVSNIMEDIKNLGINITHQPSPINLNRNNRNNNINNFMQTEEKNDNNNSGLNGFNLNNNNNNQNNNTDNNGNGFILSPPHLQLQKENQELKLQLNNMQNQINQILSMKKPSETTYFNQAVNAVQLTKMFNDNLKDILNHQSETNAQQQKQFIEALNNNNNKNINNKTDEKTAEKLEKTRNDTKTSKLIAKWTDKFAGESNNNGIEAIRWLQSMNNHIHRCIKAKAYEEEEMFNHVVTTCLIGNAKRLWENVEAQYKSLKGLFQWIGKTYKFATIHDDLQNKIRNWKVNGTTKWEEIILKYQEQLDIYDLSLKAAGKDKQDYYKFSDAERIKIIWPQIPEVIKTQINNDRRTINLMRAQLGQPLLADIPADLKTLGSQIDSAVEQLRQSGITQFGIKQQDPTHTSNLSRRGVMNYGQRGRGNRGQRGYGRGIGRATRGLGRGRARGFGNRGNRGGFRGRNNGYYNNGYYNNNRGYRGRYNYSNNYNRNYNRNYNNNNNNYNNYNTGYTVYGARNSSNRGNRKSYSQIAREKQRKFGQNYIPTLAYSVCTECHTMGHYWYDCRVMTDDMKKEFKEEAEKEINYHYSNYAHGDGNANNYNNNNNNNNNSNNNNRREIETSEGSDNEQNSEQ